MMWQHEVLPMKLLKYILALQIILITLSACGQSGPLYLPDKETKPFSRDR